MVTSKRFLDHQANIILLIQKCSLSKTSFLSNVLLPKYLDSYTHI